jgi:hypothetical protein
MRRSVSLAFLFTLAAAGSAAAQIPADPGGDHHAGSPLEVSPWAHPSDTGRYIGYQVGGGAVIYHRSEPPLADDGTWGWDYQGGHFFRRRVILNWWHGRRYQGGTGAYGTDGPRVLWKE